MNETKPNSTIVPNGRYRWVMFATKALIAVIMIAVFVGWCWLSWGVSSIALDYPLRRAGESADYPPLGTLAFYVGCAKALLAAHYLILIPGIPIGLAFATIFGNFGIKSWHARCLIISAVLLMPGAIFAPFKIYRYKEQAKRDSAEYRKAQVEEFIKKMKSK